MARDIETLSKAPKGTSVAKLNGLSDDVINYMSENSLTPSAFASRERQSQYIADRHYVYYKPWNLCGPFQDVVWVIHKNSGEDIDSVESDVNAEAFHFGNIGDQDAADYFAEMMGLGSYDEAGLATLAENVAAVEAEYKEAAEDAARSKTAESARNYNMDDIVRLAYVLKSGSDDKSDKPKSSPTGRINRKIPILDKLAKLDDEKVLKIQKYAENGTASPQKPPNDPANSRFVIFETGIGNSRIMVEHRKDLEALIKTIRAEAGDKFSAANGQEWLATFDELKLAKNTPSLKRVTSVGGARKAPVVATKPKPKAGGARVIKAAPPRSPAGAKAAAKPAAKPAARPAVGKAKTPAKAPKVVPAMEESVSSSSKSSAKPSTPKKK